MLGKLLKYDFKATTRTIVPFFIGLFLMALLNKVFISLNFPAGEPLADNPITSVLDILTLIVGMLYVLTIIAANIVPMFLLIYHFQKTLFSNEGYLMHTLSVTAHQHIWSKLIVSCVWFGAGLLVTAASASILLIGLDLSWLAPVFTELPEMLSSYSSFIVLYCLTIVIGIPYFFLSIFASVSIGFSFNKYKIIYGIGAYLVIQFAVQTISSIIALPFAFKAISNPYDGIYSSMEEFLNIYNSAFIVGLILTVVISVGLYFCTHFFLTKKLNLE